MSVISFAQAVRTGIILISGFAISLPSNLDAKEKPVPNLKGATEDLEVLCVSRALTILSQQIKETDANQKLLESTVDRLDTFHAEISQKLVNQFHVTPKLFSPIFANIRDETLKEYSRDKAGVEMANKRVCEPLMLQRESVRNQATPERCWATKYSNEFSSMVTGLTQNPTQEQAIIQVMPGMLNLLSTMGWRKWAKSELTKSGKSESEAEKLIMAEKKTLDKEAKVATNAGYRIVVDHRNCEDRFNAFIQAQKKLKQIVP